jgi:hypothetical protein
MNWAPGGRSAAHEQNLANSKTASQLHLSIHGSPKWLHGLRQDFVERWSISTRCYAQKLGASNQLNHRESTNHRAQPLAYGSNRNPWLGGQIWRLRGQDQAQRCTRHLSMIPLKKFEHKQLRIDESSHTRKSHKIAQNTTRKSLTSDTTTF